MVSQLQFNLTALCFQILLPYSLSEEKKLHSVWLQEIRNSRTSAFSYTSVYENSKNEATHINRGR